MAALMLMAAVFLAAAYLGSPVMTAALLVMIQFPVWSLLLILWSRHVQLEQSLSHRAVRHGETVYFQLRIIQKRWRPVAMLRLKLCLQDENGLSRLRRRDELIMPKQPVQQKIKVICHRRGHYRVGLSRLLVSDAFAFFRLPAASRSRLKQQQVELTIWPRPLPVRSAGQFLRTFDLDSGQHRQQHQDDVDSLAGLRDYRQGDPLKRIHWKLTARFQTIQIREFEQPARPVIMLLADHRLPEGVPARALDHVADYAAGCAETFLQAGQTVALSDYHSGHRQAVTAHAASQMEDLLWLLTDLAPGEALPMETLLLREAEQGGAGCPVCVVTAWADETLLDGLSLLRRHLHPVLLCLLAGAAEQGPPDQLQERLAEDDIIFEWLPYPDTRNTLNGAMFS
ncbi:MAG: DUF58 domain-containing protein [Eubacteriales bacterium]|nr:DUF58 domain-containing protein [Eubacteriales bacterium]